MSDHSHKQGMKHGEHETQHRCLLVGAWESQLSSDEMMQHYIGSRTYIGIDHCHMLIMSETQGGKGISITVKDSGHAGDANSNSEILTPDLLIGADGINSAVREVMAR